MTASELVDVLGGYQTVLGKRFLFDPEEIYRAATFAQRDICRRLQLIEKLGTLVTVASQERYTYPTITITDATNASPIVISAASHGFQTGDTIINGGVLGNTAANGQFEITKIDDDSYSVPAAGNGAYTSGGVAYHIITTAFKVKYGRPHLSVYPSA